MVPIYTVNDGKIMHIKFKDNDSFKDKFGKSKADKTKLRNVSTWEHHGVKYFINIQDCYKEYGKFIFKNNNAAEVLTILEFCEKYSVHRGNIYKIFNSSSKSSTITSY
jgi:hypothetical protein